eukprot:3467223-Prymnesium_polylepis.1
MAKRRPVHTYNRHGDGQEHGSQIRRGSLMCIQAIDSALRRKASQSISPPQALHVTFSDKGGVLRVLELRVNKHKIHAWLMGMNTLRNTIPASGSPAHWRWAISCMSATSERGASGFLRHSEVRTLLRRANARPDENVAVVDEALRSTREYEQLLNLPHWLTQGPAGADQTKHLNARQVTGMLLRLCTSSQMIARMFRCVA